MQSSALGWSCSSATSARTTRCLLGTLPALPTDTAMQLCLQLLQKKGRACHQCVTAGRSSAGISYGRAQQNPANGPSSSNSIRPPPPLIPPRALFSAGLRPTGRAHLAANSLNYPHPTHTPYGTPPTCLGQLLSTTTRLQHCPEPPDPHPLPAPQDAHLNSGPIVGQSFASAIDAADALSHSFANSSGPDPFAKLNEGPYLGLPSSPAVTVSSSLLPTPRSLSTWRTSLRSSVSARLVLATATSVLLGNLVWSAPSRVTRESRRRTRLRTWREFSLAKVGGSKPNSRRVSPWR